MTQPRYGLSQCSKSLQISQADLRLSDEQTAKFRTLRQTTLSRINHINLAQSCITDLMQDILVKPNPPEAPLEVDANLDLLNTGDISVDSLCL